MVKVLVPGFYARQETRIPVRYAIIALCCGMALSLSFLGLALWLDFAAPHAAMALATSLSAAINAGLLLRRLLRDRVLLPRAGWGVFALRVLLANAAMALVLWWVNQPLDWWIAAAMEQRASQLLGVVAAAAASYFLVLWVSGVRLHQFRSPG